MAIKQTNIFPIDQEPRNAVGLAYPFSAFATTGSVPFKLNYTTKEQINSNLIIWFTTFQVIISYTVFNNSKDTLELNFNL